MQSPKLVVVTIHEQCTTEHAKRALSIIAAEQHFAEVSKRFLLLWRSLSGFHKRRLRSHQIPRAKHRTADDQQQTSA